MSEEGPQWMKRPSCQGVWVCIGEGSLNGQDVVLRLNQEDINKGAPFHTKQVYGPLPESPQELSK